MHIYVCVCSNTKNARVSRADHYNILVFSVPTKRPRFDHITLPHVRAVNIFSNYNVSFIAIHEYRRKQQINS